jgi:hypothetical protein
MNIAEHAEKFLGNISRGWREKQSPDGLQVVCFERAPFDTVDTFMTLGLSHHELKISQERRVRQEFILPIERENSSDSLPSLLFSICEFVLTKHDAVLRGQVIRLPKEVTQKFGFDAFYCAIPVFMENEFSTFGLSTPSTVIVWLMPIYEREASYVDANGWNDFESLLEEKEPDLFCLRRKSVL